MKFPVLRGLLVCVINWGAGLQKRPMKQVYGLVCSVALTGKAEFAQLLFVSGCLLCMAAMVAALLSPTFGHPQVPREQHLFPEPLCGDQPRRTLPIGAGSSLHVAGVSATPSA